jgi:hypothetical protein
MTCLCRQRGEERRRFCSKPFATSATEAVGSQHHVLAALPPGLTRYPLYKRLGEPRDRCGQVRKISRPSGIEPPDRADRSESLYRLSYRSHHAVKVSWLNNPNMKSPDFQVNQSACLQTLPVSQSLHSAL